MAYWLIRVFRAVFEIGGLLNDVGGVLIGVTCMVFGYWVNQFWLIALGAFGITVSLYRFGAHLSQWRRTSNSN